VSVLAAAIVCGYLIGSIPFALLAARRWGAVDLRQVGSGNVGASNAMRTSGIKVGVLVAALDMIKGALSVVVAANLTAAPAAAPMAGVAAIVGHVYPVWLRCRGGKGVATSCGVFAVLAPAALLPALAVFLATVSFTKFISLGSVLASLVLPPLAFATGSPEPVVISAAVAAVLIVFRHRSNLARVRSGSERRIGMRIRRSQQT